MDLVIDILSSNYYSDSIDWRVKKRGAEAPRPVDIGSTNCLCFPCDQSEPEMSWNIMEAIIHYRRPDLRLLIYLLGPTQPEPSLYPVLSHGRDPPAF